MAPCEVFDVGTRATQIHEHVVRVRVGSVDLREESPDEAEWLLAGRKSGSELCDRVAAVKQLRRVSVETTAVLGHNRGADAHDSEGVPSSEALHERRHLFKVRH